MRLNFTPMAEQDFEAIADYIATDNPMHVSGSRRMFW